MSKSIPSFAICEDKNIEPHELANLFASVGWGDDADYQPDIISRSIAPTLWSPIAETLTACSLPTSARLPMVHSQLSSANWSCSPSFNERALAPQCSN